MPLRRAGETGDSAALGVARCKGGGGAQHDTHGLPVCAMHARKMVRQSISPMTAGHVASMLGWGVGDGR